MRLRMSIWSGSNGAISGAATAEPTNSSTTTSPNSPCGSRNSRAAASPQEPTSRGEGPASCRSESLADTRVEPGDDEVGK